MVARSMGRPSCRYSGSPVIEYSGTTLRVEQVIEHATVVDRGLGCSVRL